MRILGPETARNNVDEFIELNNPNSILLCLAGRAACQTCSLRNRGHHRPVSTGKWKINTKLSRVMMFHLLSFPFLWKYSPWVDQLVVHPSIDCSDLNQKGFL